MTDQRSPAGTENGAYVRFQSPAPNRRGHHSGLFALANGLARDGRLSDDDHTWWRAANARCEATYADPSSVDPSCYDPRTNPGARAWFRTDATHLVALARGYLDLLDRYGVAWEELRTDDPGLVVYADDVQVVAVPRPPNRTRQGAVRAT
ncbi:hypothetical protein ACGIF2_10735 [Cellulomonas sp. P22]|uniref:hypothetical protein n=1 Tax=Cellulomonas sp. P22 TaxID=3373189 RepID=UPI00378DCE09